MKSIPEQFRIRVIESLRWLIDLFTAWDKLEEAARRQVELDRLQGEADQASEPAN